MLALLLLPEAAVGLRLLGRGGLERPQLPGSPRTEQRHDRVHVVPGRIGDQAGGTDRIGRRGANLTRARFDKGQNGHGSSWNGIADIDSADQPLLAQQAHQFGHGIGTLTNDSPRLPLRRWLQ